MKKLLTFLFSLIMIAGYSQNPTRGALSTVDTTWKPTIKMLAVNKLDNTVVFWDLVSWSQVATGSAWNLAGNSGTTAGTNFMGTTDAQDVVFKRNSIEALRLENRQADVSNIYLNGGWNDSSGIIYKDHPGLGKTPFIQTFQKSGTDGDNLFLGLVVGNRTMTGSTGVQGSYNLGIGSAVMGNNTTGYRNTGVGIYSMQYNTSGQGNTAIGHGTLNQNTTGERNVATGMRSMAYNSSGFANVSVGFDALFGNTTADHNVAVGLDALYWSNGSHNTALGDSTLWGIYNTQKHMGYKNVAIGSRAGYHLGDTYPNYASIFDTAVTFIGANSSRDSSVAYTTSLQNSTAIGYNSRIFASNQVVLGNDDITTTLLKGRVGIGTLTPSASAKLDVQSTTQGFLPPRMTATQGSALTPVEGLLIYVTDTNGTFTAKGWWGYDGAVWQKLN